MRTIIFIELYKHILLVNVLRFFCIFLMDSVVWSPMGNK